MQLTITEEERDLLVKLLGNKNDELKEKLLKKRVRKDIGKYLKCERTNKKKLEKLEEIIRANFNLTNKEIFEKLEISKATYYKNYAEKAKELKRFYKSQSLF